MWSIDIAHCFFFYIYIYRFEFSKSDQLINDVIVCFPYQLENIKSQNKNWKMIGCIFNHYRYNRKAKVCRFS